MGRKSSRPVQPAATQFSTLRKRQAAQDYNRRTAVSRMRATLRLCGVAQQAPSRAQIAQISALRKQDALHAQCSVGSLRKFADCVTAYAERVPIEARVEKVDHALQLPCDPPVASPDIRQQIPPIRNAPAVRNSYQEPRHHLSGKVAEREGWRLSS